MPNERLDIQFGVIDDPIVRFRNRFGTGKGNAGAFTSPHSPAGIRLTAAAVEAIAHRLEVALKDEFAVHNDSGETIQTFHVEGHGLLLTVVMEGGAIYVEYGSAPHWIEAKNGSALFWDEASHPVHAVEHPGYIGDDFVGRAMHKVELETELSRLALGVVNEIVGYAEDARGVQYTAGQFLED